MAVRYRKYSTINCRNLPNYMKKISQICFITLSQKGKLTLGSTLALLICSEKKDITWLSSFKMIVDCEANVILNI